jgi:hypothetical protein
MRRYATWCSRSLAISTLLCLAGMPSQSLGQDKPHVVSLDELKKDAARPAELRQSDEAAVRSLLSAENGEKALKSANLDLQKVDKAVSQLSDEDLAKLAMGRLETRRNRRASERASVSDRVPRVLQSRRRSS